MDESVADFNIRVELSFRQGLALNEVLRLEILKKKIPSRDCVSIDEELKSELARRDRMLKEFTRRLDNYLARMNRHLRAAIRTHKLMDVRQKRKFDQHLKWTVRFQIPTPDQALPTTLKRIASSEGLGTSAVSKAINEMLLLIELERRPIRASGRKHGSKNKNRYPKILRELGK